MIRIRQITRFLFVSILLIFIFCIPAQAADFNSQVGKIAVSSGKLNVRSSPSASSSIVTSLSKGSYVTLMAKTNGWWRVEYAENRFGYCHSDYISVLSGSPRTVSTQSGNLNVRQGPGTGSAKIGSVGKGETVLILSESGGWCHILFDGTKIGYVSAQYLSKSYSPVSLWVRNMKQMDERWAHKQVASSGKTFAQIGCATTAIAMVESHRTGIVRYPDEMMTLLKYTPSGNVYWPSHYTVISNGANDLSAIYRLLKQGKPILYGATNQYGSQHWVVITGFTGGNSLTADKFTIQDPGSNSRTTLQQFLNYYPNFYKYFYY